VRLAELSSANADDAPFFLGIPTTVYFVSRRPGADQNLFVATRPSLADPFGEVVPLDDLNTPAQDTDPWLSPDGRTIYYSSDRDGPRQIYVARR
jgi:Tol biopolymer transport system component